MRFKQACTVTTAGYWGKMEQIALICYPSGHEGLNLNLRAGDFLALVRQGKVLFVAI